MRFATSLILAGFIAIGLAPFRAFGDANIEILRERVLANGLEPAAPVAQISRLGQVGARVFKAEALSLNGDVSCQQCHLEEFGSGDGIPISVGVSGIGKGAERVNSAYRFLSRNSLPLWGRGDRDFPTFFWDGRVDVTSGFLVSQFGEEPPSSDPLVVAVHLPPVETVEMLEFDRVVDRYRTETVDGARELYQAITENLGKKDPEVIRDLAKEIGRPEEEVQFIHVAQSLTAFIRERFAVRETRLHRFAFHGEPLNEQELRGGMIFFGKGRCAVCHSGPHFSDFAFHTVPFPQLGQGRNGFGIDYGRFNITHDPADLYKFRTPPLWDVTDTAPYGHSGSVATLADAIRAHFDPLSFVDLDSMDALQRHEYYKYLMASEENLLRISYLDDLEIEALVSFLRMLDQPTDQ